MSYPCLPAPAAECALIQTQQESASSSRRFNPAWIAAVAPLGAIPFLFGGGSGDSGSSIGPIAENPTTPSPAPVPSPISPTDFIPGDNPGRIPDVINPGPDPEPIPEPFTSTVALVGTAALIKFRLARGKNFASYKKSRNTWVLAIGLAGIAFTPSAKPSVPASAAAGNPVQVMVTRTGQTINVMHQGNMLSLPAPANLPLDVAKYNFTLQSQGDGNFQICWQPPAPPCPKAPPLPAPQRRPIPAPSQILW